MLVPTALCPQCSSSRIFKDGFRHLSDGTKTQRWLCVKCSYRFSEHSPLKNNLQWQSNRRPNLQLSNQICALKEAKNLEPQTEIKTVAGDSPQADIKGLIVQLGF
jgi:hypothetical protein